jgi:hypothetical protein
VAEAEGQPVKPEKMQHKRQIQTNQGHSWVAVEVAQCVLH